VTAIANLLMCDMLVSLSNRFAILGLTAIASFLIHDMAVHAGLADLAEGCFDLRVWWS